MSEGLEFWSFISVIKYIWCVILETVNPRISTRPNNSLITLPIYWSGQGKAGENSGLYRIGVGGGAVLGLGRGGGQLHWLAWWGDPETNMKWSEHVLVNSSESTDILQQSNKVWPEVLLCGERKKFTITNFISWKLFTHPELELDLWRFLSGVFCIVLNPSH